MFFLVYCIQSYGGKLMLENRKGGLRLDRRCSGRIYSRLRAESEGLMHFMVRTNV